MKQAITIEQYQELPEKSQLYFLEWMEKRGYKAYQCLPDEKV